MSPRMQRMLEQMGQAAPKHKRILELNPTHPLLAKLQTVFAESANDPRLAQCARLLYGQAQLAESGMVADQTAFTQALTDIMLRAV